MDTKKSAVMALGLTLLLSGCNQAQSNTPATTNTSNFRSHIDVKTSNVFSAKPILPKPGTNTGLAEWNAVKLPSGVGAINPVPSNSKWQPMNFGEDQPKIAGNAADKLFMANDAGVWYRNGQRWTLMPGTEQFVPITAITVTPAGAPIIATPNQILAYVSRRWIRISDQLEAGTQSLKWTRDGQLVAQVTYYPQVDTNPTEIGPAPMPRHRTMIFNGTKWYKSENQMSVHSFISTSRQNRALGAPAMGIHYIGLSPTGTPTVELMVNESRRSVCQLSNGRWNALNMSGFPPDVPDPSNYSTTAQDVTWWNGQLVVSSPTSGAMDWNGAAWKSVGDSGMTSNYHRMGSVSADANTLFAEVREVVPPPPTTPRVLFNTLWEFQNKQWQQIDFPNPPSRNLIGDPVISNTGTVAVSDIEGHRVWLYQHRKWKQLATGTGALSNGYVREMKFLPNGKLTVALVGPGSTSSNNIYEWTGTKWVPLLANNSVINNGTYWFDYAFAPNGAIIVGLMNRAGYSVWRYSNGTWSDLGLHGQPPEFLYVTKQNTLFVVTDKYVCWQLQL